MQLQPVVKLHEIGMKIRQFRRDAGFSQEKLAELVGVTPQQIQKYEAAKSKISTDKIQLIAAALKIHASDFFSEQSALILNAPEALFIQKLRRVRDPAVHESLSILLDKLAG